MKFDNQLRYAVRIIESYKGEMPLPAWLKNFFREHKQMGSRDRKTVAEMVYDYYRPGQMLKELPVEHRILAGLFLCNNHFNELLEYFKPEWNKNTGLDLIQKTALCLPAGSTRSAQDELNNIFPWKHQLSEGIDHAAFSASFLQQPDLFIRIRPGRQEAVIQKIQEQQWQYEFIPPFTVRLPNGTKVDTAFELDKEVVVQDYSSQKVSEYFDPPAHSGAFKAWDCCAASGGKSIMLHDLHPDLDLTVSDIRESILINLKKRFKQAGIQDYKSFVADLSIQHSPEESLRTIPNIQPVDLIIADLPCTGSGTWGRNPEALYFFDEKEIERYSGLQKKIITAVVSRLKKGGVLIYITCSVFKKENEEVADFIRQQFQLRLEKMQVLKGYDQKADSMFVARFINP